MTRTCEVCGGSYETARATAKCCSAKCRKARSRGATAPKSVTGSEATQVTEGDVTPFLTLPPPRREAGEVESALLAELTEVERAGTSLGRAALALARRVDEGRDTGAGLASLVKQLEATSKAATADVKSGISAVDRMRDELAERRSRGA